MIDGRDAKQKKKKNITRVKEAFDEINSFRSFLLLSINHLFLVRLIIEHEFKWGKRRREKRKIEQLNSFV